MLEGRLILSVVKVLFTGCTPSLHPHCTHKVENAKGKGCTCTRCTRGSGIPDNRQYDTLLPIIPCRHKLKAGIACCDRLKTCRDGYVLMEQKNYSFATIGGGAKVHFGETVFVFLKLPPAACTIPGYEIHLRQCQGSYNHTEPSIKIIHDKHFTTRSQGEDVFAPACSQVVDKSGTR